MTENSNWFPPLGGDSESDPAADQPEALLPGASVAGSTHDAVQVEDSLASTSVESGPSTSSWNAWLTELESAQEIAQEIAVTPSETPSAVSDSESPSRSGRFLKHVAVAGAVCTLGGLAVVAVAATSSPDSAPSTTALIISSSEASTSAAAPVPAWCAPSTDPEAIRTDGVGSTTSPTDAIAAYNHALYNREAAAVRAVVADSANVLPVDALQELLNAEIVAGTRHCVTIRPTDPETFSVTVLEDLPDGGSRVWPQIVQTELHGDRWLVVSIEPRSEA